MSNGGGGFTGGTPAASLAEKVGALVLLLGWAAKRQAEIRAEYDILFPDLIIPCDQVSEESGELEEQLRGLVANQNELRKAVNAAMRDVRRALFGNPTPEEDIIQSLFPPLGIRVTRQKLAEGRTRNG